MAIKPEQKDNMDIRVARKIARQVEKGWNVGLEFRRDAFLRLEDISKTNERDGKTLFQVWDEDKALARIIEQNAFENETVDFPNIDQFKEWEVEPS